MVAAAVQNPEVRSESKSAKKKKAKLEAAAASSPQPSQPSPSAPESSTGEYESPYIKELYKNIRNVNKKITNASKVDNVLAENPGKTLDELVASRKINADQKAQILKKPTLVAQLAQLEEQIEQYKKFDAEHKARTKAEKEAVQRELTEKHAKEVEDAVAAAKAEAKAAAEKEQSDSMLIVSQFLRLAAARRAEDVDQNLDENQALEGLLVEVYGGDENAVEAMKKLVSGSQDHVSSIHGDKLSTTYGQIKEIAQSFGPPPTNYDEPIGEPSEPSTTSANAVETDSYPIQSDPTIANAGLTELNDVPTAAIGTENAQDEANPGFPQNSGFGDEGNAAAETNWDRDAQNTMTESQEWVDVKLPRDLSETDTGLQGTTAAVTQKEAWADEKPDSPSAAQPQPVGDGFQEISRRGGRDGQAHRGGQRPHGHRGRGSFRGGRGDGRGGHRGGQRGGHGQGQGQRGPRTQEV